MSRSRSRSLPRSAWRPRSRSRSRSRSHERRLSRRSRSPVERRAGSRRNRSLSRSSSSEEERHRKKHKKHSKKAKKEEKKRHKKHKHKKDEEQQGEPADDGSNHVAATTSEQVAVTEAVQHQPTETVAPTDARSFFEQLQKQEAAKEPVGTVHSRGLPAPVSATAITASDKWECIKAGCGHMNSKHAPACNKCGAMKRLTEWR